MTRISNSARDGTLDHILSSCPISLAQGRYTWRHNHVLESIVDIVQDEIKKVPKSKKKKVNFIVFCKAGQGKNGSKKPSTQCGIIPSAKDWKLQTDLGKQLVFPGHIAITAKRPDIILYSDETKQVVLLELTVPWETRIEEAYERKKKSYEELRSDRCNNGWTCWVFPVEVGCRGFPSQSLLNTAKQLGITAKNRKKLLREASSRAEAASHWIWMTHLHSENICLREEADHPCQLATGVGSEIKQSKPTTKVVFC